MAKLEKLTSTQNYSPIRDIKNGIIITTDGRFVKLMEFSPINFELRSEEEQHGIITQFAAVLRSLPKSIQFKVVSRRADNTKLVSAIHKDMETEPVPMCRRLQNEQIDMIERIGATSGISRRFFVAFEYEQPQGIRKKPQFFTIRNELARQAATIRNALKLCGNEQLSIDDDDEWTISALYYIMSRQLSENYDFDDRMTAVLTNYSMAKNLDFSKPINIPVNDFIAPYYIDPSRSPKYIVVDDLYYSFCYVEASSYPRHAAGGWPQVLINMGDGIDVDIWLSKESIAKAQQKLQYGLRYNKVKLKGTEDTSQDYDDIYASLESGYALKAGLSGGDDFCYFGTLLTITAHSLQELEYRLIEAKNYCIRADLKIKPAIFQQLDAFKMALPICYKVPNIWAKSKRNLLLSQFAGAYPFTSFEMTDIGGFPVGTNAQNGSLVVVNPFDTDKYSNANISILGASGQGKTYLLLCLALRMREKKQQVFILAPLKGEEFERACDAVGGAFIRIAPGSEQNINIMEIRKTAVSVDDTAGGSILVKKIQQLHTFFSILVPDMTYEEEQFVDEAIVNTYAKFNITNKNKSLNDPANPGHYRKMPTLGDLHQELKKIGPPAERIYNIMSRYVTGSASSFNGPTNVDLDNKFIVIDLSHLNEDMLPIGMFIALDFVWDRAKADRTEIKSIIIDEAWRLLGKGGTELSAKFVAEIFRTIRGFGGAAIAATQNTQEFFAMNDGEYGQAVINNSRLKFLLRSDSKEVDYLGQVLDLTETEMERLKIANRGNALLISNSNHIFIDVRATKTEHDLITTSRKDLVRLREEKAKQDALNGG